MTSIPPSSAGPPAAVAPGAGAGAPTVTLAQLPPSLQSAGPGAVISGTVLAVDAQGEAVLQTSAGPVTLQAGGANLSVGQQLTLQVRAGSDPGLLQAIITSADATATAELLSAGVTTMAGSSTAEATIPAATVAPSVTAGSLIVATVIGPAGAAIIAAATPKSTTSPSQASPPSPPPSRPLPGSETAAATLETPAAATTTTAAPQPGGAAGSRGAPLAQTALPSNSRPTPPPSAGPEGAPALEAPSVPSARPSAAPTAIEAAPISRSGPAPPPPATPSTATQPTGPAAPTGAAARPMSTAIASYTASAHTASAAIGASAAPATAAAPAPASLPTPLPGTQVPLRLLGPLSSPGTAPTGAGGGQLAATVVAQTSAGQTIADSAIGRLAFAAPATADIAIGGQIAFEIAAPAIPPGAAPAGAPALVAGDGTAAFGAEWPALKSALSALAEIDPRLAQQVMDTAMARADSPRFLGQVLSLMASPADDVRTLLGQAAAESLQHAGHQDLLSRLDGDLREMARLNASATNWQVFYIPWLDSTEARQLRVFTRRHRSGGEKTRDQGGRFVVDVEFAEIGPLQLDGLVQKPRLDLILRTHAELPAALRSGILGVFRQTCDAARLQGEIFFQALATFPVSPLDEMTKAPASGVSV